MYTQHTYTLQKSIITVWFHELRKELSGSLCKVGKCVEVLLTGKHLGERGASSEGHLREESQGKRM